MSVRFVGRVALPAEGEMVEGEIAVDVELREDRVGTVYVRLDQWDDLRDLCKRLNNAAYMDVIAREAIARAQTGG